MKWADAVKASPVGTAIRLLTDGIEREGREPNVVLADHKPKAFRAVERFAWERRPLREAKQFQDWEAAQGVVVCPALPEVV